MTKAPITHVLPADTQAILLLCASFGQNRQIEPQPLTLSEYNSVAEWLRENQMRPADLLEPTAKEHFQKMAASVNPDRLSALLKRGAMLSLAVEKWTNQGLWVLGRSDINYPKRLKQQLRHLAPAILYGIGNIELLSMGGLAIVGSRDVGEEELGYTKRVATTCAVQGIQVISGGARGVDQAAMLGVLDAGGTAIAVLADSLTKAAVNSKYRESIFEGRLILTSSYDPDAGFNTGNAMGRNKYIYTLADYALVVSATAGKGGTWAGAMEVLSRYKDVPIFVRIHPTPQPSEDCREGEETALLILQQEETTISAGNRELYNRGAKPFPDEPWNDSIKELLAKVASKDKFVEAKVKTILQETTSDTSPKDIYEAVLPFILNQLQQPKDAKSLAESLDVRLVQMQDWLNRAVADDKVRKINKPVAYVVNQPTTQLSLL